MPAVCDHNIDQRGRNRRMSGGVVVFSMGLLLSIASAEFGLGLKLGLLAFGPYLFGCLMFFQATYRTCVFRAFRHQRETPQGVLPVRDPLQIQVDGRRARTVLATSVVVAAIATALPLVAS